jgi:hypothetical protein
MAATNTTFTYFPTTTASAIPVTVSNTTADFDVTGNLETCYYMPADVSITVADLTAFLTTSTTASSIMGTTLKSNITIAALIADINSKSQLDKRWTVPSGTIVPDTFWNTFYSAAGNIDYDFTTVAPKTGDKIRFIFKFDAAASDLNGISYSSLISGGARYLVGQTFVIA